MSILDLLSPKDLSKVAKLQAFARQTVEGLSSGQHRSPLKGASVEFKEHRQYTHGDELRNIDWKIFGKSDKLFVREHEEETNLHGYLLVDASGSMTYQGDRSSSGSKFDYACRLAACFSYLLLSQQDSVGLVTFDQNPIKIVPSRGRPNHLQELLSALTISPSKTETDLGGSFRQIATYLKKRGLIIILSDGMSDIDSLRKSLAHFRHAGHDIMWIQILDPDEVDFPFHGRIQFRNLEQDNDDQIVAANSMRGLYLERLKKHQEALQKVCLAHHVDWMTITTDQPYADILYQYLSRRKRTK